MMKLTTLQLQMIESWVKLADSLGIARSLAQLYGLVYISPKPLTAQQCADLLKISRSSAGQGLRALKDLGAVRSTMELGERSEQYVLEPDLGVVINNVLSRKIVPAFEDFLGEMSQLSEERKLDKFTQSRLEKLARWERKLQAFTGEDL